MRFDFDSVSAFEPRLDTLLPVGNHVVEVRSATASLTRNNNPQIELEVGNDSGTRRDWLVHAEEFGASKVVGLFMAAGVALPTDADQNDDGTLTNECVARLVGKRVGVVIRDEESYKEPGRMVPRVKGYLPADQIADVPKPAGPVVADLDIPF